MANKKALSLVVQGISKSLHFAHQLPRTHPSRSDLIQNLEEQLQQLISSDISGLPQVHGDIVATGSLSLPASLKESLGERIILERPDWSKLLKIATPDTVKTMLEEHISHKNCTCPLFQASIEHPGRWDEILDIIAHKNCDPDILSHKHEGLLLQPKISHLVESFLKRQVEGRISYFGEIGKHALSNGDLLRVMILYLSGVPLKDMTSTSSRHLAKRLENLLSSAHGRIAVLRNAPDVKTILANPDRLEKLKLML